MLDYLNKCREQIPHSDDFIQFSKELDYFIRFFKDFSNLIWYNGRIFSFFTKEGVYFLNSTITESFAQTLNSVKLNCSIGAIADANTLTRKFRDDLIQFVYFINLINLRETFINGAEPNAELQFNVALNKDEEAFVAWMKNGVAKVSWELKKKLDFENYMNVLKENESVSRVLQDFNLQIHWESIRKRLNDYVHNNGVGFSLHNMVSSESKHFASLLKGISYRISFISSFFLVLVLLVDSSLLMSGDYIDYLDGGLIPPENCQYSISGFVQDFIDEKVVKLHPALKQFLKDNNINGMNID